MIVFLYISHANAHSFGLYRIEASEVYTENGSNYNHKKYVRQTFAHIKQVFRTVRKEDSNEALGIDKNVEPINIVHCKESNSSHKFTCKKVFPHKPKVKFPMSEDF